MHESMQIKFQKLRKSFTLYINAVGISWLEIERI